MLSSVPNTLASVDRVFHQVYALDALLAGRNKRALFLLRYSNSHLGEVQTHDFFSGYPYGEANYRVYCQGECHSVAVASLACGNAKGERASEP